MDLQEFERLCLANYQRVVRTAFLITEDRQEALESLFFPQVPLASEMAT